MKVIDIIPKYPQWEAIPYAENFACQECGKSAIQGRDECHRMTLEKPNLVGWCETNNGYMAVFECPCCHSKFRFHPQMKHFDLDQFDFNLGAYYISDGDSIWIGNAKELSDKLDEANKAHKSKFVYPDKLYARTENNKTLDISYAPQTLEAVEYVRTDAFIEKAEKAFCKASCNGHPPRSTCTSLGTCKKYDEFIKMMKGE